MYYTAFYTMMLCEHLMEEHEDVNTTKALMAALVHDCDEYFSGDIVRPFKHYSKEIKEEIEKINRIKIREFFGPVVGIEMTRRFEDLWHDAKDDSLEGKVVAFADYLSVLSFLHHEIHDLGNHSLAKSIESLLDYAGKFETEDYTLYFGSMPNEAKHVALRLLSEVAI